MSDTTLWIDPAAASRTGETWVRFGDAVHRLAFDLELRLVQLALAEHLTAPRRLASAATELWTAAAFVRRVTDLVQRGGDSFDLGDQHVIGRLLVEVGVGPLPAHVDRHVRGAPSSASGDRGETGDREIRSPYDVAGATPSERGRHLVARALADTGDASQIRADEIGIVRLDNGRHLVVLPGVVDLSAFSLGWDRHHRSVRDLDQAAFGSSRSTGVDANPYARAVWDAVIDARVPPRSELMIVGHSFGADTALDLAAEPGFNGPGGYHVTHVVAAGYHSAPQLAHVGGGTSVLVLQNRWDVPVIAEAIGASGLTEAVVSSVSAAGAIASLDPLSAGGHQARSFGHQLRMVRSGVAHAASRTGDLADIAVGVVAADPRRIRDGAAGFATLAPGVRSPSPGQVVSVFDGPTTGFGHATSSYVSHVQSADDAAIVAFLDSVDAAGYTSVGVALAVDVSVPE